MRSAHQSLHSGGYQHDVKIMERNIPINDSLMGQARIGAAVDP
jgi:hypothetical protein